MSSRDGKVNVTKTSGTSGTSGRSNKQQPSPSDKLSGHKPQRSDKPGVERRDRSAVKKEQKPNTE
jgi:hypothetical protein